MPVLNPRHTVAQLGTREALKNVLSTLDFYLANDAVVDAHVLGEVTACIVDYAHAYSVDLKTLMETCEKIMNPTLAPQNIQRLKINVMVDLETLGTRPGCKVMAIGAAVFSPGGVGDTFYRAIKRDGQAPLLEDPDTLAWWAKQSKAAHDRLFGENVDNVPLPRALAEFTDWLNGLGGEVLVWGNGADFDNPILSAAYSACGKPQSWGNWNGRCYRTLKGLRPDIKLARQGAHHDALDDAISQAAHAVEILNAFGGWEVARAKA